MPLVCWSLRLAFAILLLNVTLAIPVSSRADRLWWDGTRDRENAPPGKLLSDNAGWWGESVITGVEYRYESAPDQPADIWKDDKSRFGRRLLDGVPLGDWHVPVGQSAARPLITVFDFKQVCVFSEVDFVTQDAGQQPIAVAVRVEVGDSGTGPWRAVFERSAEASPTQIFHRLPLPPSVRASARGRFLRLTVQRPGQTTFLNEALVWGDAATADQPIKMTPSVIPLSNTTSVAFTSVPGILKTTFSDAQFRDWRREIGASGRLPAVWSLLPTWDAITDKPLLPSSGQRAQRIPITLARNETDCAALALTNTSMEAPAAGEVRLSAFERVGADKTPAGKRKGAVIGIRGEIRVAGTIGSRNYGVNVGPLLAGDNLPGRSLLRRYLTNAASLEDFPRLTLSPAGSAVLWLSLTTEGATPGVYRAQLSYEPIPTSSSSPNVGRRGQGLRANNVTILIDVEVLDVTLPKPFVWLQTWSDTTGMFPFVYGDRMEREVAYKQALGVTVWNGLPTPGTAGALARQRGRAFYHLSALPYDYVNKGYNNLIKPIDLTAKDETIIAEHVHTLVTQARGLGLDYDDWSAELWDEPGRINSALMGALARIVKKADPKAHIYCNPCFWEGSGVADDAALYAALNPWYRETVDVSVPLSLLLREHPKTYPAFAAPRFVNASYDVSTQSAKSERADEIVRYRRMAWDAFARGANGWGFYSYYAPRGDPWNDFDAGPGENTPDYQMVYPGPRGPVPTRQSESVRRGWEDYCLLTLLKQRGLRAELAALLNDYAAGQPPAILRLRALHVVALSAQRTGRKSSAP